MNTTDNETNMRIWLLKLIADLPEAWNRSGEHSMGYVVRAASESQARELAASYHPATDGNEWLDVRYSKCDELTANGPAGVVLQDYWHP